jgi:4-diphosphocytidyl-2-C-methyl-D-erythritol kinase
LEVIRRRPDGFHDIETILQLVGLYDEVKLAQRQAGIAIRVVGADLPQAEENLAYRAAKLLLDRAGKPGGLSISLTKRIPLGGGLGGGSSNAAAVLAGVNRLYGMGRSRQELQRLAAELGSDVPFFLGPGLALATGRGEILRPLRPWPARWVVVASPRIAISTAWAYREASSKLTEWGGRGTMQTFLTDDLLPWPPTWAFNRLESVVLPQQPEVAALKALLQAGGGSPALMSGSGASVFAVVPDANAGERLAAKALAPGAVRLTGQREQGDGQPQVVAALGAAIIAKEGAEKGAAA